MPKKNQQRNIVSQIFYNVANMLHEYFVQILLQIFIPKILEQFFLLDLLLSQMGGLCTPHMGTRTQIA